MNSPDTTYRPEKDAACAQWVVQNCKGPLHALHRIVPTGFEKYVRIFHPGWRWPESKEKPEQGEFDGSTYSSTEMRPVSWSELASRAGAEPNGTMQWHAPEPNYDDPKPGETAPPLEGILPVQVLDALMQILTSHSRVDQDCICVFWEGFGSIERHFAERGARIVGLGQQGHFLMKASLSDVWVTWRSILASKDMVEKITPQAIWPVSKDWILATPFDNPSSFFGGPSVIAEHILAAKEVEAFEVFDGDTF